MNVKYQGLPGADNGKAVDAMVYVRAVAVAELPEDVREQIGGFDTVYAVHRPDGERLALVVDRDMAFVLARQNDLAPVSVH